MIVYFIYILLSNSCQGTIARNGCGYPAIGSRWGISIQIWVSMPRSLLPPGYFRAKMDIYAPARLPLTKTSTLSRKFSTFSQFHFNSRNIE